MLLHFFIRTRFGTQTKSFFWKKKSPETRIALNVHLSVDKMKDKIHVNSHCKWRKGKKTTAKSMSTEFSSLGIQALLAMCNKRFIRICTVDPLNAFKNLLKIK